MKSRPRRPVVQALVSFWRARKIWLALVAVACAAYGQSMLVDRRDVVSSIRWYALGIVLLIVAWAGSYRNKTFLLRPTPYLRGTWSEGGSPPTWLARLREPHNRSKALRYLLAAVALGLNIASVMVLRADYEVVPGGLGWLASVIVLGMAFVRHSPRGGATPVTGGEADTGRADAVERTAWRLVPSFELVVLAAIVLLSFFLRFYRLDDWTMGMHGDEGEVGSDALRILAGNPVSPFKTGWFEQPNFYYWGIAIGMKIFGTGLFGLRFFSAFVGSLVVLPLYGLVRLWFGVRAAVFAALLLAVSDVAIHFSREEFSNITTPFFLCAGFYFLFRGLRSKRMLDFVFAGYAHMLTMYFYLGGRLTPFLLVAVFAYLFVLMPLVGLPRLARDIRARGPGTSRGSAFRQAVTMQWRTVSGYFGQILVFAVACFVFVSPLFAYLVDHSEALSARTNEKFIFSQANTAGLAEHYGINHVPLYLGIRLPHPTDIYPVLPIVFEPAPVSLQLAPDGFQLRLLWNQLTTTLSILTYRFDASGVYTFTGEPVTKPLEAVLVILGIAYALWRWRDTRMAVLSLWFWLTVVIGGVLTIDAPYMARLVGIIPTLAIFAAVVLDKLFAELLLGAEYWRRVHIPVRAALRVATVLAAVVLIGYLAGQNYTDYFGRYLTTYPFSPTTGQAYFVREMNRQAAHAGRPTPYYYNMGVPVVIWNYGVNRFLNNSTPGEDLPNPAEVLPLTREGDRDVIFIVWDNNAEYLPVIRQYYPGGEEGRFNYSADGKSNYLFTYYRLTRETMARMRTALATYRDRDGQTVTRPEPALGTTQAAPPGLGFPLQAQWTTGLIAPQFGHYRLSLAAPRGSTLTVDGVPVLTTTTATPADAGLILARGPHQVRVLSTLARDSDKVDLRWAAGDESPVAIDSRYLWSGTGRGLVGQVRPLEPGGQSTYDPYSITPPDTPGGSLPPVIQRRVDGFLGFRSTTDALKADNGLVGDWSGTLAITETAQYGFELVSQGGSVLIIDGNLVVDNRAPTGSTMNSTGDAQLTRGTHSIDVRYTWAGGVGRLELYWKPPGESKSILATPNLRAAAGVWQPGTVSEPPPFSLEPQLLSASAPLTLTASFGAQGELDRPGALAVDKAGRVYVADRGHSRIVVYSPDGRLLNSWGKAAPTGGGTPPAPGEFVGIADLATSREGLLFVLDSGSSLIQVFNPDGVAQQSVDMSRNPLFNPGGLSAGPDGRLYIADTGGNRIVVIPGTGDISAAQSITQTGSSGSPSSGALDQPLDVASGGTGSASVFYAVDLKNRLVQFDPNGAVTNQWALLVGGEDGGSRLATSPDGRIVYMSDPDRAQLVTLDTQTGISGYVGGGDSSIAALGSPTGVAVGPDGKVYVADSKANRVLVFSPR